MSSKTLSSKVKIKTSELPPEVLRRYGLFDDHPELDLSRTSDARRQDQRLKDDITNVLYRLELDSVKPSFDVSAQTGFRKGHYLRKRNSPGEDLIFLAAASNPHREKSRRTVRPHSYIEPQRLRQPVGQGDLDLKFHDVSADHPLKIKGVIVKDPVEKRSTPVTCNYSESRNYPVLHSTFPTYLRSIAEPEGGRVLSEYKDTFAAPVRRHQRWSVYGSGHVSRSQSTPPETIRSAHSRHPVGDRLTRTKNREYSIGVKLAESQTDLDTFNRLLEKRFGGGDSLQWRSSYNVYPSYSSIYAAAPVYYEYLAPGTGYSYTPRTRVISPTRRSVAYGCAGHYVPYIANASSSYTKYLPSSNIYNSNGYRYESWYLPYYPRSTYYTESPLTNHLGRYTTRYFY